MPLDDKKIARLTRVARMYYEENQTQDCIAKAIGVSRPMVSKLLTEAREYGIVVITVKELKSKRELLVSMLKEYFSLKDVILVENPRESVEYKEEIIKVFSMLVQNYSNCQLAISCGSALGNFADFFIDKNIHFNGDIFPLIGGFKATFRSYHTDELVRSIAHSTKLNPHYLYLPALLGSEDEKMMYKNTDLYKHIEGLWKTIDLALVNISSSFSTPDFATSIRFGKKLIEAKSVGRFLAYYYDIEGNLITPYQDNVIQVDLSNLKTSQDVVALCLNCFDVNSVIGAMNSKIFNKVVLPLDLAENILDIID